MVVGLPVAVRVAYPSVGAGLPHKLPFSAVKLKFTAAFSPCIAHARLSHLCRVPTCGLVILGRSKRRGSFSLVIYLLSSVYGKSPFPPAVAAQGVAADKMRAAVIYLLMEILPNPFIFSPRSRVCGGSVANVEHYAL